MRSWWKEFSYYSRAERRGIVVLFVLLLVTVVLRFLPPTYNKEELPVEEHFEEEYAAFVAGLKEIERQPTYRKVEREVVLIPFDPNSADSATFVRMGLPPWMAGNILKYRRGGGVFRRAADFRKIYGLTEEQFQTLLPYIAIAPFERANQTFAAKQSPATPAAQDRLRNRDPKEKVFKYVAGSVIELNEADTTELQKIPGIGSYTARKIAHYRNRLGGFYHISQLAEIELDPETFAPWFSIEAQSIHRINLNRVGIERLRNHPYFNFYQAKAIVEYRKKKGKLKQLNHFALYEEFTEQDFERMQHYVCFE